MPLASAAMLSVTPMIPTGGPFRDALAFFIEQMGFSVVWEGEGVTGIRRDAVSFTLVENGSREWAENASFSIGVADLDGLFTEYAAVPARVGEPAMMPWGRREFHMILASGVCFQFYEQAG